MMTILFRGTLVFACAMATSVSGEEGEDYFLLTREAAECIAINREHLAEQDSSVVFIKPQECVADGTDDGSGYAPAEAPDVTMLQAENVFGADALLFLSRTQLACFADLSVLVNADADAQEVWRFYPDTCHFARDA